MEIERELLVLALEYLAPCNVYNPYANEDGSDWDEENERCIPFHEFECERCITFRRIQMELDCNEAF